MGSRVSKKNLLKLSEISPALYSLRNTEIQMPGYNKKVNLLF